ncbi:hypothetical protein ABZY93_23605 [Streptomyces smyrnaeus]|uniref:hypothetical protein n=1 Tax=Streptomyces smyrnaeus TaxID=1387713 RepID=UPI00339F6154
MTDQLAISTLTLQRRIPDDWAADVWAEVRPLIDGIDALKGVHPEGVGITSPSRRAVPDSAHVPPDWAWVASVNGWCAVPLVVPSS